MMVEKNERPIVAVNLIYITGLATVALRRENHEFVLYAGVIIAFFILLLVKQRTVRFDRTIHTQQLNLLADITADDVERVDEGMTKCSRFLEGHDEAEAVADPVPGPTELRQDVANLETWITEVRRRRR